MKRERVILSDSLPRGGSLPDTLYKFSPELGVVERVVQGFEWFPRFGVFGVHVPVVLFEVVLYLFLRGSGVRCVNTRPTRT